jgi:hypothetical protein
VIGPKYTNIYAIGTKVFSSPNQFLFRAEASATKALAIYSMGLQFSAGANITEDEYCKPIKLSLALEASAGTGSPSSKTPVPIGGHNIASTATVIHAYVLSLPTIGSTVFQSVASPVAKGSGVYWRAGSPEEVIVVAPGDYVSMFCESTIGSGPIATRRMLSWAEIG